MNEGQYFMDDGTEYNPNLYPKPALCLVCSKVDDPQEEVLCNLNRMDQYGEDDFKCYAYEKRK